MNSLLAVVGLSLAFQTPEVKAPSAEESLFDGRWRVTTVAGDRSAVLNLGVLSPNVVAPKGWMDAGVWRFSKGTMTREGSYFIRHPPRLPPMTDKDVETMAKGLEPRLGKKRALEFAREFQRSLKQERLRLRRPGYKRHDISYLFHIDPKQSPMQIEILVVLQSPRVVFKPGGEKKDVVIAKKDFVFSKHLGIYKQEGETTILVCLAANGQPRPTQFKVTDRKQQVLLRLKKR